MNDAPITLEALFAELKSLKAEVAELREKQHQEVRFLYKVMRADDEAVLARNTALIEKLSAIDKTYVDNKLERIEMTLHAVTAKVLPGLVNFERDVTRCVGYGPVHLPEPNSSTPASKKTSS